MSLRSALTNIHRDSLWWRKILIGGALMLTLVGYPFAAGLVVESLDNTRKGFPTPLPPWRDWSTRYLIGLFAVLIDFVFFVMPVFLAGLLFFCGALAAVAAGASTTLVWLGPAIGAVLVVYQLFMFASSVAPVSRLIYTDEGRPEDAIGMRSLRVALGSGTRLVYLRARIQSLLAYLPALLLGLAFWWVAGNSFPGVWPALVLLLWLTMSALLYAQLVVVQLYAAADRAVGSLR